MKKSWFPWIIVSIFFIFLFLLVFNLSLNRSIWFDEGFSTLYAQKSVSYIIQPHDVHPQFYYLILHGWIKIFSSSFISLRSLSIIFGLLSFFLLYKILRVLFKGDSSVNKNTIVLVLLLFSFSSVYLHYFTEIRMYAMALFFCLLSFYLMLTQTGSILKFLAFCFCTAILPYIHYYTVFFILGEILYVFFYWFRPSDSIGKKKIAFSWMFIFILTIPIIIYFFKQRARIVGMWFQGQSWASLLSTVHYAFFHVNVNLLSDISSVLGLIFVCVVLALVLILYICRLEGDEKKLALWLFLAYAIPPFLGMAINRLIMPVYHHRFFFFTSWILVLLVGRAICVLMSDGKKLGRIVGILSGILVLFFVLFNLQVYFTTQSFELRDTNAWLQQQCGDDVKIVIHESPFSMLPGMVLAPCYQHYVYSELNEKEFASAGGDVIGKDQIISNKTELLKFDKFYYMQSEAGSLIMPGFDYETMFVTDGLNVTLATRQENRSVLNSLGYSKEEYLMNLNGTCRMASDCFINNSLVGCEQQACNWCCNAPRMLAGCTLMYCMVEEEVQRLNLT